MSIRASTAVSLEPDSEDAGRAAAKAARARLAGEPMRAAIVYATVNHDQEALLGAIRDELGDGVAILGCSTQGIACDHEVTEDGLAVAIMGFGGDELRCAAASAREIAVRSVEKGESLGSELAAALGAKPRLAVLVYDPLCGADVEAVLSGMRRVLAAPVIGGAAGQPWGPPVKTYQYFGADVFSHGAVALALSGPIEPHIGLCHGAVPTGLTVTLTKVVGNKILEIDGRRATDVWCEQTGLSPGTKIHQEFLATAALGLERRYTIAGPNGPIEKVGCVIRGYFGIDFEEGALVLQAAVPEGGKAMFYRRDVDKVLSGTKAMAHELVEQLRGKTPWAVLGFECAARTFPFLGSANTREEHLGLRSLAAPTSPWLGMMAWGELAPLGSVQSFHNYTYPVVMLTRDGA